ncbi:MAG: nitrite/sulfite reductase [Oscillospiraceae bacterium]|nr:nitrite/sulfite reductase [Oscillospiraceae bacterium]
MDQKLKEIMRNDIALFAEKINAFDAGEVDKKAYKGFSGGFGSYAQRNGGNMLRLRMAGGRLTKERLKYLADSVEEYNIDRMKLTTCQTIQFHNLPSQATIELMEKAIDVDIITRGGGGDFTRNTMASPLSGVEVGEYFDVMPWAEAAGEYMLTLVRELHMPRKLKVCFSNSPANVTHATFRDLGFAAREDGKFDVYCAGGLGPNPKLGVKVVEALEPEHVPACIDAMIQVFCQFGNYENRAKARTRYLQETLGEDGLKEEFNKALVQKLESSPKLSVQPIVVDKAPMGQIAC